MTDKPMTGQVALVTGAAGEIGRTICAALRDNGAAVVATDRAGDAAVTQHDITEAADWQRAVTRVKERYGRLDVLVNNAGVAPMGRIEEIGIDEWRACMAVNVEGALLGMQHALPLLRESSRLRPGGAAIVNVASAAANRPSAMSGLYCASKASLVMLSKVAALEFARGGYGVRVNTVNPGAVRSVMIHAILDRYERIADRPKADLRADMEADVPLGRLAEPEDVADGVVYLASSASRFVTGTELHIDGGLTM